MTSEPLRIPPEDIEIVDVERRRFLAGTLVGGAVGVVAAAGTGIVVWRIGDAELVAARQSAEEELERLRGLVALYEQLERVGLDAILQTGLLALTAPLELLELGTVGLRNGLESLETALLRVEVSFPAIQQGIIWVEDQVSAVAGLLQRVEDAVGKALDRASPITAALGDLVNYVLDRLPFGAGEKVREALDRISELVGSVPELVEGLNTHLLEPLREDWFSTEEGEGIGGRLIEPLVSVLLNPLEEHLDNLATLLATWESKLSGPVQTAIEERHGLIEQIDRYREQHGLLPSFAASATGGQSGGVEKETAVETTIGMPSESVL